MNKTEYRTICLLIIICVLSFPIYQLIKNSGLVFYTNGWDEASYLQYDYAKHVVELSKAGRLSEYLVIYLHDLGLSGGQINLLFDVITTILILLLLPKIFEFLKYNYSESRIITLSLLLLPLLLTELNPIIELYNSYHRDSSIISWLTLPYIKEPYWLRSPEPQASIIGICLISYLALKLKKNVILILSAITSYLFISIPFVFCYVSFLLNKKLNIYKSIILSFIMTASLLYIFKIINVNPNTNDYLILTRLPLLSFTGLLGLLLLKYKKLNNYEVILLSSIWFSTNFQIISGYTIQPNNFEQYWSVIILSYLVSIKYIDKIKIILIPLIVLLNIWCISNARQNLMYQKFYEKNNIYEVISKNSSSLAVNDIILGTKLDLLLPKQKPTLFSITITYKTAANKYLPNFNCAKRKLYNLKEFENTIHQMNELFSNGDKNYIYNTIGRVTHEKPVRDFNIYETDCTTKSYNIFFYKD